MSYAERRVKKFDLANNILDLNSIIDNIDGVKQLLSDLNYISEYKELNEARSHIKNVISSLTREVRK